VALTDGDNGLRGLSRPFHLDDAASFYYFALAVTAASLWLMARFVGSPFGAALRGTRDQPRRMSALGHNVWLIRWISFVYAGFWGAVSGLLFVYYHKYIHPISLSLTNSAEGLLAVIAGGSGTLAARWSAPRSSCSSRITSRRTSSAGTRCSAWFSCSSWCSCRTGSSPG